MYDTEKRFMGQLQTRNGKNTAVTQVEKKHQTRTKRLKINRPNTKVPAGSLIN